MEKYKRKTKTGKVISDRMDKTRVVVVERSVRHPLYEKVLRKRKKYYAHDENNASHTGDFVMLEETRPLSKLKRWRVVKIIRKGRVGGDSVQVKRYGEADKTAGAL